MTRTIAIALSGGIDSLVTAHLLQAKGARIIGLHFITGYETGTDWGRALFGEAAHPEATPPPIDAPAAHPMHPIGNQLGIPVKLIDCRGAFRHHVVAYFTGTYQAGQTPNPCMVCNPLIKFGLLRRIARTMGAEAMATGHYARIRQDTDGSRHLLKGRDQSKDQSYFLAFLTRNQLQDAYFPLGDMHKKDVVALGRASGLQPVTSGESQDVCFIRESTYGEFLANQKKFTFRPGPIEDVTGAIIGRHPGLHRFTVGQRRGINVPAAEPYYVVRLDPANNRLVVGFKQEVFERRCTVGNLNWIQPRPAKSIPVAARLRYRHQAAAATLTPLDASTVRIEFDTPQEAITPGQAAVFYREEEVIGGGFIKPPAEE